MRKGVYGFYRRIGLSENLIIIANSDVLFRFKIFSQQSCVVVLNLLLFLLLPVPYYYYYFFFFGVFVLCEYIPHRCA